MRCEPKTAGVAAAADEALCTESVYERADLDADGIVDFFDFALLGAAWKSLDPDNCPVDPNLLDPNDFARWNAVCDFNTDHIVDMKDMGAFADGWLWVACWYKGQTELGEMMSMSQGGPSYALEAETATEVYEPAAEYETLMEIVKWLAEVAEEEPDIEVEIDEFMKVIQENLSELQEQLDL